MERTVIVFLASLYVMTCNAASAQTTVLVCEGQKSSVVNGFSGADSTTVTITRVGGKVVKAVESAYGYVFTTKKIQDKPGVFSQLIVEKDRIILRTENEGRVYDIAISNTGAYQRDYPLSVARGQCSARAKMF